MTGKIPKRKKRLGVDEYGRTPLHYVKEEAELERLIRSGLNVDHQDDNGWTPLHFSAQEGTLDVAIALISAGADTHLIDVNGNTPLWVAAMNSPSNAGIASVLLEEGSDPLKKNKHGVSPYDISPELFDDET